MPRIATLVAVALLGASGLFGCDTFGPRSCPASIEPGVEVEVVDGVTGAPVAGGSAGTARDGAYVDSLRATRWRGDGVATALSAAWGRAGVYRVEVRRQGYRDWARDDVRARRGECGVETARVRAALTPAP
jgi:hypothetical protein